jgi:pimeloyl-ACP methyl ester carboxylesterase
MRRVCTVPVGALLLAVALTLAGLQPRAGAAPSDVAVAAPVPQALQWAPCPDIPDTECAGIAVPVDPARPDGPRFTLRVGRMPALDPAQRQGVLLIIPGGPGPGISKSIGGDGRAANRVDEFRRQWDVVSFDPRGLEQSNPIRCSPDLVPPVPEPTDRPPTAAEFEAIARTNAAFFQSCAAATGELMAHLSATDTAADIEQIRLALSPNDGLVTYAASYGSQYGQAYLERYPEHVKAMVLDAVMDHSIDLSTFITRNVLAVQDGFERFAQWCDRDSTCALHGQDVGTVFDAVVAAAPVTRILVPQFLAAGRDPDLGWPAIAQMLADVRSGNTATLDELAGVQAAFMTSAAEEPSLSAGKHGQFPAVLCADYGPQQDYAAFTAAAEAVVRRAPRFAWRFWDATPIPHGTGGVGDCAGWPFETRNPPHRLQVGSHPNVMVASATHDPQTPLINALAVWLQIPDARLLIGDADGHQALPQSDCVYEAIARFLADPAAVPSTTLCPR